MKRLLSDLPRVIVIPIFIIAGVAVGLFIYIAYMSRLHVYASDDSAGCVNCHIMAPYYESWSRNSHSKWTCCNDCHVPQDNPVSKYAFKAMDGLYHATLFTFKAESQVIRPRDGSSQVIMDNCIRCHTQLNSEFVNSGMVGYTDVKDGRGKACWDCHRDTPHTERSNISSSPHSLAPMPSSPVPQWMKDRVKDKNR